MRLQTMAVPLAAAALLSAATLSSVPAAASAAFVHTVLPGESLSSVAATDGLTVGQLAEANGLPPTTELIAGSQLAIPPQSGGPAEVSPSAAPAETSASVAPAGEAASATPAAEASTSATPTSATPTVDGDGDGDDGGGETTTAATNSSETTTAPATNSGETIAVSTSAASPSGQQYVVQPGDTLTAIAERAGTTVAQLAAANGLDPSAPLLSGTTLTLGGAGGNASPGSTSGNASPGSRSGNESSDSASTGESSASAATSQPVGEAAEGSPGGPPYPTSETVSPAQVESIATADGVPPSLANAIAYMESGFNNELVSSANARGVMQITPGTWSWINQELAGSTPLSPSSALENVRGGVLLLHSLLEATGGNQALAAAGYYQGLPSVRENGLYPSTQQYVSDVEALRQQFGG